MLVLRTRHRDTQEQRTLVLDEQCHTLFEVSRLLDHAVATSQEVSLFLESGDHFPLNPRLYDAIALVQPSSSQG